MTNFADHDVHAFFEARQAELLDPARRSPMNFTKPFKSALPTSGGVYVFFHGQDVFYVGETTSIRQRIGSHMRNPENHVLALKIARLLHDQLHGRGSAGSTKKFQEPHKEATRQWVQQNLHISFVPMLIGRKELEERLFAVFNPEFNKRYPQLPIQPQAAVTAA